MHCGHFCEPAILSCSLLQVRELHTLALANSKMSCTCFFASLRVVSWSQLRYTAVLCGRFLELADCHDRFCSLRTVITIAFGNLLKENIAVAFANHAVLLRSHLQACKTIAIAFAICWRFIASALASTRYCHGCDCKSVKSIGFGQKRGIFKRCYT